MLKKICNMKNFMKISAMVLIFAIIIGIICNKCSLESSANEKERVSKDYVEGINAEKKLLEYEEKDTSNYSSTKLDNGEIQLVINKKDGSRIRYRILEGECVNECYNKDNELVARVYESLCANANERGNHDKVKELYNGKHWYQFVYNEELHIGCDAKYKINYAGLTNEQRLLCDEYVDRINDSNTTLKIAAATLLVSLITAGAIIKYGVALLKAGETIKATAKAIQKKFSLVTVILGAIISVVERFMDFNSNRERMKAVYRTIRHYGVII